MKKEPKKKEKKHYRHRKCPCCHKWFMPQPQNAYHQRYCTAPACRLESKRESARRYRRKHRDENKGSAHVLRVQNWRKEHPGYGRNTTRSYQFSLSIRLLPGTREGRKGRILVTARRRRGRALQNLYLAQRPCRQQFARNLDRALRNFINSVPGTWYPRIQKRRIAPGRRMPAFR